MQKQQGFSLLEMMVVLAVISILLMIAIPAYVSTEARDQIRESLALIEKLKAPVELFSLNAAALPATNAEAGLPPPDKLLGNYVQSIELQNGAFHIAFGNKAVGALQGKFLSVRAISVTGSPGSPVSWVCGYSVVPAGMEALGENRSTVGQALLPVKCRAIGAAARN